MSDRIHIAVDAADKERYRQVAEREGKTLSVWLREAAEEKWGAAQPRRSLESRDDLEAFFSDCDASESGREPDWEDHRTVIEESTTGRRDTR
jgi:hypothetical protein